MKIEYNRYLCLLMSAISLIVTLFSGYGLLFSELFDHALLTIIARILLGLITLLASFYFILFFVTGVFLKYGIIIQNGVVTLGMPLGGYVFRLDKIKSASIVMNNNMNAENIFVELYDEAEWISQQKGWSAFWVKFSRRFFKSSVIISSYILKVNPHELVNVLNGVAGEQDSTIDQ